MSDALEAIRQKQQKLIKDKEAAAKFAAETAAAAKNAFISTGIPAMWVAMQDIQVPHWRGNGSRDYDALKPVPLKEHLKELTDTALTLRNWADEAKICWKVETTDKGALWFTVRKLNCAPESWPTGAQLRDHFVDYMANFLPPLGEK